MRIRMTKSSVPATVTDVPIGGVFRLLAEGSSAVPILKIGPGAYFDLQNNCKIDTLPNDLLIVPHGNAILNPCVPCAFRPVRTADSFGR